MPGTPRLKIYNAHGQYIAACKFGEDAAALVGLNGPGATIRFDHRAIVWREGSEDFPAADSYDGCAQVVFDRIRELHRKGLARAGYTPAQIADMEG